MRNRTHIFLLMGLLIAVTVLFSAPVVAQEIIVEYDSETFPEDEATAVVGTLVFDELTAMTLAAPMGSNEVLLIKDLNPFGYRRPNEEVLKEYGVGYDVINSKYIPKVKLGQYKFVIFAAYQRDMYYSNICANMKQIEAFVENGGCLLVHMASKLKSLPCSILPGGVTHVYQPSDYVDMADPLHCVTTKVTNEYLDNWKRSTHGHFTNLVSGTNVIMMEQKLKLPTYIEYTWGKGRVMATMQPVEYAYARRGRTQILRNEIGCREEWCSTCYSLIWLPPIQVMDQTPLTYTMQDGSTLPIKFAPYDSDGIFVVDESVLVRILDPKGFQITSFTYGTGGSTDVRIETGDEAKYIVNLHTKDYAMVVGRLYTVEVSFGGCVHTTTFELIEGGGKAKGKSK